MSSYSVSPRNTASDEPLVTPGPWHTRSKAVVYNFYFMCLCFSLNHGCVTAILALASASLGDKLGGFNSGTLYTMYTLSSLFIASLVVRKLGPKWSLVGGLALYVPYVASFLIAVIAPSVKWPAAIFGSTLGGFAAGWLWTAQGAYFTRTAKLYAKAKDIELVEATGWLGGIFATAYVGGEVLCKVASSALHLIGNDAFVYSVFTIVAVVSAGACAFIKDMPEEEKSIEQLEKEKAVEAGGVSRKVMLAVDLLRKDRKMQLLAPMNMTFGFTAAFINYFVNGTPVKAAIGESNIGYMAAVTPGIATLLSIPFSYLTKKIGKLPAMVFGASCYLSIAVSVGFMSENTLEGLGWGIVYVYILGGCGRSIFEGTNKATFSDFFPNDTEAAFANVGFFSGGAPALAFFIFPYLSKTAMSLTVALTGVVAVVCLFFAFRIHEQEKAEREAGYPAATMMGFPGVYEDKSDLEKQNEYEHGFGYEKAEDHTRRRHN